MDMDTSQQPQQPQASEEQTALTPEERRQQHILSMSTTQVAERRSAGERLLPYCFIATESCWMIIVLVGLASTPFSPSHALLIPFWTPFVFMAGVCWLSTWLEGRDITHATAQGEQTVSTLASGTTLVYLLFTLVTLIVIWVSMYSSSAFLLDPRWLLALLGDILSVNGAAFHVLVIVLLALFFCWRGVRLSRQHIEPATVVSTLRIGVGVILALVLIQALASGGAGGMGALASLLWLIPVFLSLALLTHALAQAVFQRRVHSSGLLGSAGRQERAMLGIIGILALLLLLIALLVGTFASPAFLAQAQRALSPLGRIYDGVVYALSWLMVLLVTPIFWLLSLLHVRPQMPQLSQLGGGSPRVKTHPIQPSSLVTAITPYIEIILPILLVVLLVVLIRLALRRRRIVLKKREEDTHESLWSWALFWSQLKALLRGILNRLFPRRKSEVAQVVVYEESSSEPAVRTIREIYRAFLRWSAGRGYPRKRDETPLEFKQRLDTPLASAEAELAAVTEAYSAARYGGVVPDEAEIARVRTLWQSLQQKS